MLVALVRRPERDVDAAAVGLPSRNSRSEMLVRVGDAAVVLFLELVFQRVGCRIAPQPELFDELLALFVRLKTLERGALLIGDDVEHILAQPLPVRSLEIFAEFLFFFLLLFFGKRLGYCFAGGRSRGRFLVRRRQYHSTHQNHQGTTEYRKTRCGHTFTTSRTGCLDVLYSKSLNLQRQSREP